jgi:hypothetical protein
MIRPFPFAIVALIGALIFIAACPSASPLALAFAAGMGATFGAALTVEA